MEAKSLKHPFSYTLGAGPYRLVDFFTLVIPSEANQGRNNFHLAPKNLKSGCGTCDHCGHGIINNYIVQNGLGERFAIGSECVEKAGQSGEFENMSVFEKHQRQLKRKQGQERREKQRIKLRDECFSLIDKNLELFATIPHCHEHWKNQGATMKDYFIWARQRPNATLGSFKFLKQKLDEILK